MADRNFKKCNFFRYFTGFCIAIILTDMVSLCPDQLQRSSSSETGLWGRVQYDP
jgi:hypothetical protein